MKLLSDDEWYDLNRDKLMDDYYNDNPEKFPCKETYCEMERDLEFQLYVDERYLKYRLKERALEDLEDDN